MKKLFILIILSAQYFLSPISVGAQQQLPAPQTIEGFPGWASKPFVPTQQEMVMGKMDQLVLSGYVFEYPGKPGDSIPIQLRNIKVHVKRSNGTVGVETLYNAMSNDLSVFYNTAIVQNPINGRWYYVEPIDVTFLVGMYYSGQSRLLKLMN
jgi:hypothetical protein